MTVTVTITAEIDPEPYRGMDPEDIKDRVREEYSLIELAMDGEAEWDVNCE